MIPVVSGRVPERHFVPFMDKPQEAPLRSEQDRREPMEGNPGEFVDTDESGSPKPQRRGGKLSRSETVTVRLDPRLRYLAELAARKQRRTLSSFIEWTIEEILGTVYMSDDVLTLASQASLLWDVDEADRFAKLALTYPDLLLHEEQVLWKLIRENGHLWKGHYDGNKRWVWQVREENLIFERLRESWEAFKSVAYAGGSKKKLPAWPEYEYDELPF
jgi:hypothetical protein